MATSEDSSLFPSSPTSTTLLDLPIDILLLILPYLDVISFLSLTATCRALHTPQFANDSVFWTFRVRRDFRVPNRPAVQNDGSHWRKLYKRLRTQSKVFTWGDNEQGCLGHSYDSSMQAVGVGRGGLRVVRRRRRHATSPGEMEGTAHLGIIADLQCGGWSTTLLSSNGALHTVGVLNDEPRFVAHRPSRQRHFTSPTPLRFPPGFVQPRDRHDPATAIKQFSSGRAHVLGLSDSGRIWSWTDIEKPAVHVKFLHHNTKEDGSEIGLGAVKQLVAGWNKSAALIEGSGIVVWEPSQLRREDRDSDTVLITQSEVVPGTRYIEPRDKAAHLPHSQDPQSIGEVLSFVVLEACILFNTSLGKVFASRMSWDDTAQSLGYPVELQVAKSKELDANLTTFVTDVQGSFRSFAILTSSGSVLTGDQDHLLALLGDPTTTQRALQRIPALQNKQVISLAFGDYHFHALHSPGYITSYGKEPQACGALGLGGQGVPEGRLRGIRNQGVDADGKLVPHAYTEGRRVWFENEKREWVTFLTSGGVDQEEAAERIRIALGSPGIDAQGEVSEWIEQEGRDWEGKFGIRGEGDEDGSCAHFALSVSAAGWHSGALVLVDEQIAEKLRKAVEIPDLPLKRAGGEQIENECSANDSLRNSANERNTPSLWDQAADWGRYFLGLAPYNVSDSAYDPNAPHLRSRTTETALHRNPQPRNYGASPRDGYHYIWAEDHFPRLKLSDGAEMPGTVPFDNWRYGRPTWKLDWDRIEDDHEVE